jgi:hypothetical protein
MIPFDRTTKTAASDAPDPVSAPGSVVSAVTVEERTLPRESPA